MYVQLLHIFVKLIMNSMAVETLSDLVWKMECKGFDSISIHFHIHHIWMLFCYSPIFTPMSSYERKLYEKNLAQAHIEIDFTGYQKKLNGQFSQQ